MVSQTSQQDKTILGHDVRMLTIVTGDPVEGNPDSFNASSSSTTTTTGLRACVRAREAEGDPDLDALAAYYCQALDRRNCPSIVRSDMRWALRQGMTASVIAAAIDDTIIAPMPSWRYAMAIITRCIREGCLTLEAYDDRTMAHRDKAGWKYSGD